MSDDIKVYVLRNKVTLVSDTSRVPYWVIEAIYASEYAADCAARQLIINGASFSDVKVEAYKVQP